MPVILILFALFMADIAKLQEQIAKLQREVRNERRKSYTRKKILYGTALLRAVEAKAIKPEYLTQLTHKFIKKSADREFLGLPNLAKLKINHDASSTHDQSSNSHQATVDETVNNIVEDHSPEHSHQ